jgi:putative transposase
LKKVKKKQSVAFPKFKKKYGSKQSYKTNLTSGNIQVLDNRLKLPKLGWIKFHKSQEITGKLVNVTVTRTPTGKHIASILCETEIEKYSQVNQNIGLDLGIKSYLITSNNEIVENPKYHRTQKRKLRSLHKKLSRTSRGSSNRVKAKTSWLKFTNELQIYEMTFCINYRQSLSKKTVLSVSKICKLPTWLKTTN